MDPNTDSEQPIKIIKNIIKTFNINNFIYINYFNIIYTPNYPSSG